MAIALFNDYDIVTDGKFIGVLHSDTYDIWTFYFGIYNHKYFSFYPKYILGTYGVAEKEDFRLATDDEISQFCEDCKSLGYAYDHISCNFIDYKFNRKIDFVNMKLPHYVPFHAMAGKTISEQFLNDYERKMFWIFDDNTYTYIDTYYECDDVDYVRITSSRDQLYDYEDAWDGEHIINWWDSNRDLNRLKEDDFVIKSRQCWWYFASMCVNYNFYSPTTIEALVDVFKNKNYTKIGEMFIKYNMIDESDLFNFCKEYFEHQKFNELIDIIRQKKELEKLQKENNKFDIL